MNTIFFTDLDGTLIFSAKRSTPEDVVVEYKDGEPISCITAFQKEHLRYLMNVVPVTTRSIEQYKRIRFPEGFAPEYAITDNGGNLLINGEPDPEWAAQSVEYTKECAEELSKCREILERDIHRCFEIRMVDGLFLFTKSSDPAATVAALGKGERVESFYTGEKVYVIPKKISKGEAAKRLLERVRFAGAVISAGDSEMDLTLLNIADYALYTENISKEKISVECSVSHSKEGFPQFVTEWVLNFQRRR